MSDDENVPEEVPEGGLVANLTAVCKEALLHDGLKRGLHEVAHVLDNHTGKLCLLAEDCDKPEYTALIQALCEESGTPLQTIESRDTLGDIVGLGSQCGGSKGGVKCTCAVITNFGRDIAALQRLKDEIKLD